MLNVEKKLAVAAKLIRQERDAGGTEIAARLHNLNRPVKNRKGEIIRKEGYLPWLTAHPERMALHIKIKTWLQDSGCPLGTRNKTEKPPREPRKQDFSLCREPCSPLPRLISGLCFPGHQFP